MASAMSARHPCFATHRRLPPLPKSDRDVSGGKLCLSVFHRCSLVQCTSSGPELSALADLAYRDFSPAPVYARAPRDTATRCVRETTHFSFYDLKAAAL